MNRLYLLGAVALSQVAAYVDIGPAGATHPTSYAKYTYTGGSDCFTTGTATPLGLNNIYYQYYAFDLTAGTVAYSTWTLDDTLPAGQNLATNALNGCAHEHLYNWMAQPVVGASGLYDGISDAIVAYGYLMTGTTLAACTLSVTTVTTTLYASSIFTGARFQHVTGILTGSASLAATTTTAYLVNTMLQHYGPASLYTAATTGISIYTAPAPGTSVGTDLTSASNSYYDFAQQQVFQGQTQFGRGGGASTAPCGWWVFYTHEGGIFQDGADPITGWNLASTWKTATVHMWTDNAMTNTIGAFVLAALGAALY